MFEEFSPEHQHRLANTYLPATLKVSHSQIRQRRVTSIPANYNINTDKYIEMFPQILEHEDKELKREHERALEISKMNYSLAVKDLDSQEKKKREDKYFICGDRKSVV